MIAPQVRLLHRPQTLQRPLPSSSCLSLVSATQKIIEVVSEEQKLRPFLPCNPYILIWLNVDRQLVTPKEPATISTTQVAVSLLHELDDECKLTQCPMVVNLNSSIKDADNIVEGGHRQIEEPDRTG